MPSAVGHVTPWGVRCGVARHLSYWLAAAGDARPMHILAERPPAYYGEPQDWPGPAIVRCWARSRADSLQGVQDAAGRLGIRLLHFQFDPSFWPSEALTAFATWAAARDVKTVMTAHTYEDGQVFTLANKAALRTFDRIVVGTPAMRDAWQRYADSFHIVLRAPIQVIPLPVPELPEGRAPRPEQCRLVLTWGMLGKGKGIEQVFEAVRALRGGDYPELRYLVVGQALTGEQRANRDRFDSWRRRIRTPWNCERNSRMKLTCTACARRPRWSC